MKKTLLSFVLLAALPSIGLAGDDHAKCNPNDPKCKPPACCAKDKKSCCDEAGAKAKNTKSTQSVKPKAEKPVASAAN